MIPARELIEGFVHAAQTPATTQTDPFAAETENFMISQASKWECRVGEKNIFSEQRFFLRDSEKVVSILETCFIHEIPDFPLNRCGPVFCELRSRACRSHLQHL